MLYRVTSLYKAILGLCRNDLLNATAEKCHNGHFSVILCKIVAILPVLSLQYAIKKESEFNRKSDGMVSG